MIGTGAFATREVIEMNKKMAGIGANALSVITPYFNAISQYELIKHYEAVAEASSLPLMMYNIPAKTGLSIGIGAVAALHQHPMIKGIKDSAGNFDALVQMIKYRSDDFAVFAGTDSLIYWNLLAGGDGAIAATANAVPDRSCRSGITSRRAITKPHAAPRKPCDHCATLLPWAPCRWC